jgi:hypothetical protein
MGHPISQPATVRQVGQTHIPRAMGRVMSDHGTLSFMLSSYAELNHPAVVAAAH